MSARERRPRVLHAAYMSEPASGVINQMEAEQRAANDRGLPWTARLFAPSARTSEVLVGPSRPDARTLRLKLDYYRWLRRASADHDILLLRYLLHDPLQLLFLRRVGKPVLLVHHALEAEELSLRADSAGRVRLGAERLLAPRCLAAADGIVGVTDEIVRYERARLGDRGEDLPAFVYPNGIVVDEAVTPAPGERPGGASPELLFVSSVFAPWQGLEDLIGVARTSERAFRCHVVGRLSEAQREALAADARFVAHGELEEAAIAPLAAGADLGISVLRLDRKGMEQACALKVREYLRRGLPVYSGCDDVFPPTFPYFRRGSIDIDDICDHALAMRSVDPATVIEAARPFIDKGELLVALHDALRARYPAASA